MLETKPRRIALFIDFENLVTNTGITAAKFDLQPSLDRLLEKGKVIFRVAYCDWSRFREAKTNLHEHGVALVDVPPSARSGKNGADMRLVIDALELCYAREHIDTFVIASGDSDFCPLAAKLRENDRFVIGLAVKSATSPMFIKACDEFIYLDAPQGGQQRRTASRRGSRGERGSTERAARPQPVVPDIAREAVQRLIARATDPINPSLIKEALVRKQPDFDERDHGFATFSRMLEALEREGVIKRLQQGRQWYVVSPDAAPRANTAHDDGELISIDDAERAGEAEDETEDQTDDQTEDETENEAEDVADAAEDVGEDDAS